MNEVSRKKYSGVIGLGLMYVWCCAIFFWAESDHKFIAFIGGLLVSANMTAVFFYISSLEDELKEASRKIVNGFYEDD